jgi:hypothetical protein
MHLALRDVLESGYAENSRADAKITVYKLTPDARRLPV